MKSPTLKRAGLFYVGDPETARTEIAPRALRSAPKPPNPGKRHKRWLDHDRGIDKAQPRTKDVRRWRVEVRMVGQVVRGSAEYNVIPLRQSKALVETGIPIEVSRPPERLSGSPPAASLPGGAKLAAEKQGVLTELIPHVVLVPGRTVA